MKLRLFLSSLVVAAGLFYGPPVLAEPAIPRQVAAYVGTYTNGKSKGIYRIVLDTATGQISEPALVAETPSPSFLAIHPNRHTLLAVN